MHERKHGTLKSGRSGKKVGGQRDATFETREGASETSSVNLRPTRGSNVFALHDRGLTARAPLFRPSGPLGAAPHTAPR